MVRLAATHRCFPIMSEYNCTYRFLHRAKDIFLIVKFDGGENSVKRRRGAIGLLILAQSQPRYYTRRHADLARTLANQAAVALENARLYEQAQQLATLQERQRLARELHDSVAQALYSIALSARTARTLLDRDPGKLVEPLD